MGEFVAIGLMGQGDFGAVGDLQPNKLKQRTIATTNNDRFPGKIFEWTIQRIYLHMEHIFWTYCGMMIQLGMYVANTMPMM